MKRNFATLLSGALASVLSVNQPALGADRDENATTVENPATAQELPRVVVIGTAPLPGLGLPLEQVAGNVQTASSEDLKRQQSLDMVDLLNNNFSGVNVSEGSANPFQADVNYHGFTASPLIGTPQGLSVYVDGVRVNEAFGDTVNWDLIPESAISNVTLMSGSNPVFGLNTLGGALAVQTKSGHEYPGTELQAYGGSFGRRAFEAETGGASGNFDYFLSGNYFDEDGWRDLSNSKVKQLFGKAGWQDEQSDVDLSYAWADTALIGNGTTPQSMLDAHRAAIFSAPDFTNNKLNFVNLTGSHFLDTTLLLSGNVFYRHLRTHTNNGDVNADSYQSDEYDGPEVDCGNFTSRADVAFCANGINRSSTLRQRTFGLGAQITATPDILGMKNQAVAGVSFDRATVDYLQSFQYAALTPQRSTVPIDNVNNALETVNSVGGTSQVFGVYFTDTFSPNEVVHITASARYNRIRETLDGYSVDTNLGDFNDGFNAAEPVFGDHTYSRVNPSLGLTYTPSKALTLYANYNEGSRAPTVIELGCSNPDQPCGLPNDFASDPELQQVISRTAEIGARGSRPDGILDWSVDLFHTNNTNDIQFVATTTSQGYFANVGSTRRQGADFAVGGRLWQAFKWHLVYSFVDATYRSVFQLHSESNSSADDDGNIQVRPGNRIPLIARHTGRLRLDYALGEKWDFGGSLIAAAGVYLHGNENNANQADGGTFLGSGKIPGYAVVNLDSTWHFSNRADLFIKVVNVLDKRYATAGFLTSNAFNPNGTFRTDSDHWTNENAVSPAQPIAVWAGLRVHFN